MSAGAAAIPYVLKPIRNSRGERVSGAACHCCLLLPETACEKFNRELDRAVLVGDARGAFAGYFGDAIRELIWPS